MSGRGGVISQTVDMGQTSIQVYSKQKQMVCATLNTVGSNHTGRKKGQKYTKMGRLKTCIRANKIMLGAAMVNMLVGQERT